MRDVASLYRAHAGDLLRFARSLTGDADLAEEAVAAAFARVLDGPPAPDGVRARPWLFGVTRHVCLDMRHARSRRAPEEALHLSADGAAGPEAVAEARDALAGALDDLAGLPEDLRAALLLRVQEGLSHEAIGEVLGITSGAARVRVHRARTALARRRAEREGKPWK
jgi:RNA polymerase sigma-70 factor (ECF subfamily)